MAETTIKTKRLQVDRKIIFIDLKENDRGKFLKITEQTGGMKSSVIVPLEGVAELIQGVEEVTGQ